MIHIVWLLLIVHIHVCAKIPQKVVICGVCKDVAVRVPHSMKIMEKIGDLFADYRIVVYENNSSDNTPQILKQWMQENKKVFAMSEVLSGLDLKKAVVNRLKDQRLFPSEAIARARNIVLDKVMSETYRDFLYVIWMDMDFKIEPVYEGFKEVFASQKTWDAVFSFGICPDNIYWDWYAFRDHQIPIGSELLGNDWWYLPKRLKLDVHSDWYPVYSAFGGCGIYKKSALQGCRYSGIITEDLGKLYQMLMDSKESEHQLVKQYRQNVKKIVTYVCVDVPNSETPDIEDSNVGIRLTSLRETDLVWRMSSFVYKYPSVCEHVSLHASMIMRGHDKLFINPRLIFYYGG